MFNKPKETCMNPKIGRLALCVLALLALATPLLAHHGTAISFDMDKQITLKGTVTEFKWTNPHVSLHFDVKGEDGKVVPWSAEATSPYFWAQRGYNKNAVKPGDEITITLHPGKAGNPSGLLMKVMIGDRVVLLDNDGK
jgi:hypothetical protein